MDLQHQRRSAYNGHEAEHYKLSGVKRSLNLILNGKLLRLINSVKRNYQEVVVPVLSQNPGFRFATPPAVAAMVSTYLADPNLNIAPPRVSLRPEPSTATNWTQVALASVL